MTELINAAMQTKSEFLVAPYFSTPQIIYLFQEKKVHACMGSLLALTYYLKPLQDATDGDEKKPFVDLDQIITDFDLENGTFWFVDKKDMVDKLNFKTKTPFDVLGDVFLIYGALYSVTALNEQEIPISELFKQLKMTDLPSPMFGQHIEVLNIQAFMLMKIIYGLAPILNTDCALDCLKKGKDLPGALKNVMGLQFNNEIYFQMSKGLLPPDILEMICLQKILPSCNCSALIAPSMCLKYIWENESDYKFYYQ